MRPIVVGDENEVIKTLALEIEKKASRAIALHGVFRIGLSGGSLVKYLSTGLPDIKTDWSAWRLFFCDERFVDESDPESTSGLYKKNLIGKTGLTESQFISIDLSLSLDDCAKDYENKILKEFNLMKDDDIPEFDLLLLGMGPDGHTCSLFPGHKLLKESHRLIAPIDDSPKPPPQRVTMTFPIINNSNSCIFAMSGAGKAEMVKRVFVDAEDLPAAMAKPKNGNLKLILDKAAAGRLQILTFFKF